MIKKEYDVIVVGSGPNGLAAAITLQQEGLSVLILEGKKTPGGGMRSAELTLPGYIHDVCSAIHPMAAASPFFKSLPLQQFGLEYKYSPLELAHPFDNGKAAVLERSVSLTAAKLGRDEKAYLRLFEPIIKDWPDMDADILAPLHFPRQPLAMGKFGIQAIRSARQLSAKFQTDELKGLWAGAAAHAIQPLTNLATSAIALVLMTAGHMGGWPFPKGGSNALADALLGYFISLGGKLETDYHVKSLKQLPSSHAVVFDVTPQQLLQIAGHRFSSLYKWQLNRYRHGPGIFKMDFALDGQVPFIAEECRNAATVHIGNTLEEIAASEKEIWEGRHSDKPFVLLAQQSVFDSSRSPEGKHAVWAYCHVPFGSVKNMAPYIENQIERFAPGFKERILARHTMNTKELEDYNPNYIGGDIAGGVTDLGQLFTRPALRWSPYRSSAKGLYICSSSTPPGGGVHGMCGYHAAKRVLKDIFKNR